MPDPASDRTLPLRERKRLRTRRALADAALRLFTERGFDATTLDELVDEAEVSRSTFFRTYPAKEAAAIEAEAELWSAYLAALADRPLTGVVLDGMRETLTAAVTDLEPEWDRRYVATRRLIRTTPALLAYVEYHRHGVKADAVTILADRLELPADDLRLHVLAELVTSAWSVAGREWVRADGRGGRDALTDRVREAFAAVPAGLALRAR
jgi:AcrR family transcriptional regulator